MAGRDEELALILRRLDAGAAGVLLTGGVGTGKSRLAREAVAVATAHGQDTSVFVCTRATSDIPLAAASALAPTVADSVGRYENILADLRARPNPAVVLIDDVDRLDSLSMALIHQALSERLIQLVATVRSGGDRDVDVVSLWKDLQILRIEILPLARPEVAAMLAQGLGGDVDALAVKHVWTVSGGVPLYVIELVRDAVRAGVLVIDRGVAVLVGPLPTPASLADLVQLRLDGLDDVVLRAAEVIGIAEALPIDTMLSLTSTEAVEQLEARGVVEINDGDYRLTHALFGDVVRSSMSGTRLRRIMSELADLVDARGVDSPEELIRVAVWRLESGSAGSPEQNNAAAHAAYRIGDFPLAKRLAEAAHAQGVLEASLLLAQILHESGLHAAAEEINLGADLSRSEAEVVHRAVVQRGVNLFFGLGRGDDALAVLEQGPGAMAYNRSWFLVNMGRISDADAVLHSQSHDPQSFLVSSAWIAALAGRADESLHRLDELAALGSEPGLAPGRFRDFPDLPRTLALLESGHLTGAASLAVAGHEASVERHPTFVRAWWLFLLGRIHTDMGRMRTAASFFQQGEVLQAGMNQPGLMRWYLGGAAYALAQTNDSDATDHLLAQCHEIGDRDERAFSFLADSAALWRATRQSGREPAIGALVKAGDGEALLGAVTSARRLWFDAVRLGGAREVGDRLTSGGSDLDDARAALGKAQIGRNPANTAEVAEFFGERDANLWAAEAWAAAGALYLREDDLRLATWAARSSDRARQKCEEVETSGLVVERDSSPLTEREREVVAMAARGTASRDIAEALFISVRTVNNLIQRSYVKLGVTSRGEAAMALGLDLGE